MYAVEMAIVDNGVLIRGFNRRAPDGAPSHPRRIGAETAEFSLTGLLSDVALNS